MQKKYSLFCALALAVSSKAAVDTASPKDNASLEHKNTELNTYLDHISTEQEEKTHILDYILKEQEGCFVDLGTGGDSIAYILEQIPSYLPVTLIASDIDQGILDSIPKRHPSIAPFLHEKNSQKLQLDFVRMDATNMSPLDDSSINGISASALTHEIFSYVPIKTPLEQFFAEITRVLKKDGVFIYRDAKWDNNPEQDCVLILKDQVARFFSVLFLPRFLDRDFSGRVDYKQVCIKPTLYEHSYIRVNFYPVGSNQTKKVTLEEFIHTPLCHVDLSRNISIEAPRGLISELQRHYVLFLRDVFIVDLIDSNFFESDSIDIECLSSKKKAILKDFLAKKHVFDSVVSTVSPIFLPLALEKERLCAFIKNGIVADILDKEKVKSFCEYYYSKGVSEELLRIDGTTLYIEAKLALLLFHDVSSGIYAFLDKNSFQLPLHVFEWMKREGEEYYFYKTTDEFITYVGKVTQHSLLGTNKEGYLLCPINTSAIKTAPRELYKTVIEDHMDVMNMDGNKQSITFEKSIIHFRLLAKEDALRVYNDIIEQDPYTFVQLKKWVQNGL